MNNDYDVAQFQLAMSQRDEYRESNDTARALLAEFLELWDGYEMTAALPIELRERIEAAIEVEKGSTP